MTRRARAPVALAVSALWASAIVLPTGRAASQIADSTRWASAPDPLAPPTTAPGVAADPVISADGTAVAFSSTAANLVNPPTAGRREIFVNDSTRTEQVSVRSNGTAAASGASSQPSISADGRFVAFASEAALDPADDDGGTSDVYVRDRKLVRTELVSATVPSGPSGVVVTSPSISGDGRYVAMVVAPVAQTARPPSQVHVYDRLEQVARLASHASGSEAGGAADSFAPALSADGSTVAFASNADLEEVPSVGTAMAPGPGGGPGGGGEASVILASRVGQVAARLTRVFVWERPDDRVSVVSVGLGGARPDASCGAPAISHDGSVVAYGCVATNLVLLDDNLVLLDTNGTGDVFVTDRSKRTTALASVTTSGIQGTDNSCGLSTDLRCDARVSVSGDGRFVAFSSLASNLLEGTADGDTNGRSDVFVRDRASGTTVRVSLATDGSQVADGASTAGSISGDGRLVAFLSTSRSLTADRCRPAAPQPCTANVFVRARPTCFCSPPTTAPPPVSVPLLSVTPGVVPQGRVSTATGSGFPPSTRVDLSFDGRDIRAVSVTSTAAGTVRAPVVVPHGARTGARTVTAKGGTRSATAALLVVVPSAVVVPRLDEPTTPLIFPRR